MLRWWGPSLLRARLKGTHFRRIVKLWFCFPLSDFAFSSVGLPGQEANHSLRSALEFRAINSLMQRQWKSRFHYSHRSDITSPCSGHIEHTEMFPTTCYPLKYAPLSIPLPLAFCFPTLKHLFSLTTFLLCCCCWLGPEWETRMSLAHFIL